MSIPGIGVRRKIKNDLLVMQAFNLLAEVPKKRKQRAIETKPRDMAEKKIEKQCLDWLWNKREFLKYGKTEMGASYHDRYLFFGFPDLTVFNLETKTLWFIELKKPSLRNNKNGGLSDKQVNFREYAYHISGNVKHLIIYSIDEMKKILL